MATSTPTPSSSHAAEIQSTPAEDSTHAPSAAATGDVNGFATQLNAVDALPHALSNGNGKQHLNQVPDPESSSGDNVEPIVNVESGIRPVASYLGEITKHNEHGEALTTSEDIRGIAQDANGPVSILPSGPLDDGDGSTENVRDLVVAEPAQVEPAPLGTMEAMSIDPMSLNPQSPLVNTVTTAATITAVLTPQPKDEDMLDVTSTAEATVPLSAKVAREREDDEEMEPLAKRARTETPAESQQADDTPLISSPAVAPQAAAKNSATVEQKHASASAPVTVSANTPSGAAGSSMNGHAQPPASQPDFGAFTDAQLKILLDGLRNIKKSKSALAFLKPVDGVALNIPHYHDIVKTPMDLSTMEQRLKGRYYESANQYITDFDQMVQNSVLFNGAEHMVTNSAKNLRSVLTAQLKRLPRSGEAPSTDASKKQRKRSLSGTQEKHARPPRPSLPLPSRPSPTAVATVAEQIYALDHDGMPQIRRHSSIADGRPKREIHRPPPKDLPYTAKPKKKKYQLELRFCQETLDEITRPAYINTIAAPFLLPVDPVALNIPNYRSLIKKPMDLSTAREKLNTGMYENAKEFEQDVKLIFHNCYKFNGKEHPVSRMGADLERAFDEQWAKKNDWVSRHAPASAPQSPDADESDSEEEEEEEEEDDEEVQRSAQLEAIHGQFAQLSAQLLALQSQPSKKTKPAAPVPGKKTKVGKEKTRRKSSMTGGSTLPIRSDKKKSKPKEKKIKAITNAQKEEISEKIGLLTTEQMARAAEIIKTSLRKAGRADLADRADDEMEFEIDQIPDEALHELLKLVRKNVPVPGGKVDDTDYRPAPPTKGAPAANQGKARKNKPMKGAEQEQQISRIKQQLDTFQARAAALHSSDGVKDEAVTSSDDDDSGSESEEE